jgi:hypothetical protein
MLRHATAFAGITIPMPQKTAATNGKSSATMRS